jgi:hypothetical protein
MNSAGALRKMTELRLIELASQLHVRPGGTALECTCWKVFADFCTGHDTAERVYELLAAAETFLLGEAA